MLNTLAIIGSEFFCLILAVAFFVWLIGIRVSCPNCSTSFHYKKGICICPVCSFDLVNPYPLSFDGPPDDSSGFSSASQAFHFQKKTTEKPEKPLSSKNPYLPDDCL